MVNSTHLLLAALLLTSVASAADTQPALPAPIPARTPQTQYDIPQLPNDKLDWLLDAKLGMFIHWGLYSGPGKGEWLMENQAIPPDQYRKYAFPESGEEYFDAKDFHPDQWAQLAKDAGMKWLCLTARHHDGFCLFDSPHPNAFTSMQTLHRDLIAEYTTAVRAAGLKVGLYYSPLSWRYPGYYDVTGTNCAPNKFGYKTDPSHLENARLMKEENYVNVKTLLTHYGTIDHLFWDGGWLAQKGSDADAAFFHEPGKFLDPANRWPISKEYLDLDPATNKPLGIMGMTRRYQPDAVTNLRYGWLGDIIEDEGPAEIRGPIRSKDVVDKCLTMQNGGWGYNAQSVAKGNIMTRDQLISYLANATVRNMVLLVNVAPDRHGTIPDLEQQRLRELGAWLAKTGDAFYNTRAGPFQPLDRQYGYCYKNNTLYLHLLPRYQATTFQLPPLGPLHIIKATDVFTNQPITLEGTTLQNLDRASSPPDTIIALQCDRPITDIWK